MDRTTLNALLAQYAVPEVSGEGQVGWEGGAKCIIPSVKLYGKCEQDGTPSPEAPVEIKCNNGTVQSTSADGTYDGGTAQAPELLAIPGTEYRDEWDAQTGRGIRRCVKVVFDGTEPNWKKETYNQPADTALVTYGANPLGTLSQGKFGFCNKMIFDTAGQIRYSFKMRNFNSISFTVPVEKYPTVSDFVADVKKWAEEGTPLIVIAPAQTFEDFFVSSTRLTMPFGPGQIIQTGGDVADCPITAQYLTHS